MAWLGGCRGAWHPWASVDAGDPAKEAAALPAGNVTGDGGLADSPGSRPLDAPPDVVVWAADRALRDGDLASARRLLGMALAKLGTSLTIQPVSGLLDAPLDEDPDAAVPRADVLSDFAANGSVLAVAQGGLLSVVELRSSYRVLRLAGHPVAIRQVKVSASGRFVATFADDQILRLFSLPTGSLLLELPLSLDFLALGERRHAELFAFSPDSRRLFALDCGERAGPSCPLVRLRVFDSERGDRRSEISLPAEPLDYTSRSDGTVAVLPQGSVPRFFDADSGMEWPQRGLAGTDAPTEGRVAVPAVTPGRAGDEASVGKGDAQHALCLTKRHESSGSRPWLISPDRLWLLTLASPSQACLWDVIEHRLAQPIALPRPLSNPALLSLLADARVLVLGQAASGAAGARATARAVEVFSLAGPAEKRVAIAASFSRGSRKPRYPLSILPLDHGGAFWTAAPLPRDGSGRHAEGTPSLDPDGQLCLVSTEHSVDHSPLLRCLPVPGLWQQADGHAGPLAVRGDGQFAFFGSPVPLLVDVRGRGPVLPIRLLAADEPQDDRPSENAEILDDGRLVTLDVEGNLRAYALPAAERTYSAPQPMALRSLSRQSEHVQVERRDGSRALISLQTASLRRVDPAPSQAADALASTPPEAQALVGARAVLRIVSTGRGALTLVERRSRGARLRLQFLPDASGNGAAVERRGMAAVLVSSDGHFERIGEASLADIEPYVVCRVGPYQAPLVLCAEQLEKKGLLAAALAWLRSDAAEPTPPEKPSR